MSTRTLSPQTTTRLLALARASIRRALDGAPIVRPADADSDTDLEERRGAFVTLTVSRGRLRGCIGRVDSPWPLWETVARMARAAAFGDPRFQPLVADELDGVRIEVSALTPLIPVNHPGEIITGVHGVMVEQGVSRGLFLPQVAPEQGWDRDQLLDQVCMKAGLEPDAWRSDAVTIYVFTAEVFAEPEGAEPEGD